jgi:hypothetical protein
MGKISSKYQKGIGSQVYQAVAGSDDNDQFELDVLSDSDYIEYWQNLDKTRIEQKRRWSAASQVQRQCAEDLLTSYGKLRQFRSMLVIKDGSISVMMPEEQEKLNASTAARLEAILQEIKERQGKHADAVVDLEREDQSFQLFQQDQGRVIGAVEKHKVFNIRQQRSRLRNSAHISIVRALNHSELMTQLPEDERAKHISDVVGLLRELEEVEGQTDELVQRLELKISAIHVAEQHQTAEIEDQLQRQEQLNQQLEQLNETISQNNEALKETQEKFRSEVAEQISAVTNTGSGSIWVLIVVAIVIAAILYLMINNLYKSGTWPFSD